MTRESDGSRGTGITVTSYPDGLRAAAPDGDRSTAPAERGETIAERNERVWGELEMRREQGDRDPALAAQEHYAYARLDASTSGVLGFARDLILVPVYEAVKFVVPADMLKMGNSEVSPASVDSLLSGWKGAFDGLADYMQGANKPASSSESGDRGRGAVDRPRDVDSMGRRERDFMNGKEWA